MSRKSQPTWLAPCLALATRINPGILPKAASDVTYVQSSFICGNKACSFRGTNAVPSSFSALRLPQWQQPGAALCGTEAPSLLAPPRAAPPTVAPSGDSTEPRSPLEPAHHLVQNTELASAIRPRPVLAARHLMLLRPLAMPSAIWYVRS